MDLIDWMCFGLFKDSGCDFKQSELLYFFIQNLAGVITISYVFLSCRHLKSRDLKSLVTANENARYKRNELEKSIYGGDRAWNSTKHQHSVTLF